MATTTLTYTDLTSNAGVARPAGTTLVAAPTDDMSVEHVTLEETVLDVTNSNGAATIDITVKAGAYPPAWAAGQGDLVVTVAADGTAYIGPLDSGRFLQADGSVTIESSATTGTIRVLRVPRDA